MTRQVIDGQMQEFLGQPDATARLAWLEQFFTQDANNTIVSEENIKTDNIIELALALKTEATRLMRDEPEKAQQIAGLIDEIAIWSKNPQAQAISDWTWGNARFFQGHHQACLDRYKAALRYYEQTDRLNDSTDMHINCANAYTNMGEYGRALSHLEHARNTVDVENYTDAAIDLEMTLALTYSNLDEYENALEATERGIVLADAHNLSVEKARLHINQSLALEGLGRFDEAILFLENAQQILASTDEKLDEALAWLELGTARIKQGDYRQALLDLDLAHHRFEELGNRMEMTVVDFWRARAYLELNLLPEAIRLSEASQLVLQGEHNAQRYSILADYYIGVARSRLGEVDDAGQYLDRASHDLQGLGLSVQAALVDLERARLLANLPSQEIPFFSQTSGQTDILILQQAEALSQAASDLFQMHNLTLRQREAQTTLADIQRQYENDMDALRRARENYQRVLADLPENTSSKLHYRIYYGLGKLAEQEGMNEEALRWYSQAIDAITDTLLLLGESELRGGYLYDKLMIFQAAIGLNLAEGDHEAALHLIELARTGAWQVSVANNAESLEEISSNDEQTNMNQEQLRLEIDTLRTQWHWYYRQLYGEALSDLPDEETIHRDSDMTARREGRYSEELRQIEQRLKQAIRMVRLYDQQTNPSQHLTNVTLETLREQLEPQQCILVYYVLDDQVVVFLITLKQAISLSLDARWTDICFDLDKLYFTLNRFDEKTDKHLHRLWKNLFAPLLPYLEGYPELIIIPHDRLYHLPFHALYNGEEYLLQHYQIQYMPTINWIVEGQKREWNQPRQALSSEQPTALIMAYSDKKGASPIPGTLEEAKSIYHAWNNATEQGDSLSLQPELYLEEDALAAHLYKHAHKGRLFHLATHGKFRSDNPLFSTLLLGDGPISLADLEQLHLSAHPLVALSACTTGVSNLAGAGVLGISHAFLQAGASMVLVSLWRVEDRATALLMESFHHYLIQNLAPAQALRQSQIKMIGDSNFAHPSYWAGWTLVG